MKTASNAQSPHVTDRGRNEEAVTEGGEFVAFIQCSCGVGVAERVSPAGGVEVL